MSRAAREALWSTAAALVLVSRFLATITTVLCAMLWLVTAIRDSLLNVWLWWFLGSGAALLLATYAYSWLRVQYPKELNDDE
ncbi:MAG: hypothetical protein QM809_03995 [Gordonia sp. (in: high G+C Gram-positive bacteria)]|uniref:hypothetical protein n=1 Tax=Gordonia sp. (in: high G+C Gram-positive bacteria) TaxID=84139 RepID=UPI0039E6AF26